MTGAQGAQGATGPETLNLLGGSVSNGSTIGSGSTDYLPPVSFAPPESSSEETYYEESLAASITVTKLVAGFQNDGGGSWTVEFTIFDQSGATAIACTATATSTSYASCTWTGSVTIPAGSWIVTQVVVGGGESGDTINNMGTDLTYTD